MRITVLIILTLLGVLPCRAETTPAGAGSGPDRYDNSYAKDFVMDAPWRVTDPDTPIPLTMVLKDCDEDDIRELHWIRCQDITAGEVTLWYHDFDDEQIGDHSSEDDYWVWITTVTEGHPSLPDGTLLTPANLGYSTGDRINLKVSIYYKDDWFNYTETRYLRVRVGSGRYPWPVDWYGGDVHYHSMFTNNIAEFGAPVPAITETASAMGLQWLVVTDHSCDLDETGDGDWSYATGQWEYTLQTPDGIQTWVRHAQEGGSSWSGLGLDVTEFSRPWFRLFRGVELNLASVDGDSWEKTLHCLFNNPDYIHSPWSGAIGERPVFPAVPDGLAQLGPTGFAYAAHPVDDLGGEGGFDFTVNGAAWGDQDYTVALQYDGFRGLEIFNTRQTLYASNQNNPWPEFDAGTPYTNDDLYPDQLLEGIDLWDQLLSQGLSQNPPRRIFVAGGSDAHGDFNYATFLNLDTYASDNAMGKVQTVVRVPGYSPETLPPVEELMAAYGAGLSCATDGPFLEIGLDRDGDGDWYETDDLTMGMAASAGESTPLPLVVRWASIPEFGEIILVRILAGSGDGAEEIFSFDPTTTGEGLDGTTTVDLAGLDLEGWRYFRGECLTTDDAVGHRAYTNPIWLDFGEGTGQPVQPFPERVDLPSNYPNPFNPQTTICFELPSRLTVELALFDPAGHHVVTLFQGSLPAGGHTLPWSGLDRDGNPVGSGLYLCRLIAGTRVLTSKMMLLR
jgi:hypothetical protein